MKINYVIIISFLLIKLSCNKKETPVFKKTTEVKSVNKRDDINTKKEDLILKNNNENILFAKLETKQLPIIDSTNFDNFKQQNKLSDSSIKTLNLKNINKHATEFYANYKIKLSNNFQSIIITTKSEMEMKTFLINFDNQKRIIDQLQISYDEIAESAFVSIGKITKQKISVENYNYMPDIPEKALDVYEVKESGKFIKK